MAIGPTASSPRVPGPAASSGGLAASRLSRALQDAFGFRGRDAAPQLELAPPGRRDAEEADRRQLSLEEAADQIRLLNPNAPRGSIVNVVV